MTGLAELEKEKYKSLAIEKKKMITKVDIFRIV